MDVAGKLLIALPLVVGAVLLVLLLVTFASLALRSGALGRGLAVSLGTLAGSSALAWLAITLIGPSATGCSGVPSRPGPTSPPTRR